MPDDELRSDGPVRPASHEGMPAASAERDQVGPPEQSLPKDPFLAILTHAVNLHPGWEIGVTLHVSGVIVSGMLCSVSSFFEEQAETIRRLGSAESAEARDGFAQVFDTLAEESQPAPDAEEPELPDFIHLRAATVHAPGTDAVLPETLWRGRLDHVSGWSVGNLGPKITRAAMRGQ